MKNLFALALLCAAFVSVSAHAEEEVEKWCVDIGQKALAAKLHVKEADVSYHTSALVGDGINSVEAQTFQVKGQQGIYLMNYVVDGCELLYVHHVNN